MSDRLVEVGRAIDVGVADADAPGQDRHRRVLGDVADQLFPAARDDEVDRLSHAQHLGEQRAVGVLDELDGVWGTAGGSRWPRG